VSGHTHQLRLLCEGSDPLYPELDGPPPELLTGDDIVTEGTFSGWAVFSADRVYRYLLGRCWNPDAPWLVVGMLNPSKAGATESDPTITRVIGFAKRDGFGGILAWNACALISTDPKALLRHAYPVGPRNSEAIELACRAPDMAKVVVAWGKPANRRIGRYVSRAHVAACVRHGVWRLGDPTKDGHPRHPLYLRADTPLVKHTRSGGAK
jgi:hypothetical protein